jgi:hypothetical protein
MKLYTHEWETKHDQIKGFIQATGLQLQQRVFKVWKLRIVTDTQLFTGGEYTRNLRKRLEDDKKQEDLSIKNQ